MTTREVVLDGGSPWGFRLHGGADQNQPLRISRVNPGSKAALRGIREGDFITSINNQSTKDITNAEAHALLRNSGDTLKLGLNEDCNGSPKRRQYKTVHQETHSETVKKSSITSYTVTSSKTISQTEASNELKASNVNGHTTRINGESNDPARTPVVSQRSTLSSTCSSSSSTPSTYTSVTSPSGTDMADNARSRRKRTRNNRKKPKSNVNTVEINETIVEEAEYSVESPKRVKSPEAKKPVKSRSFDDDCIKIQELSEVSESEDKSECKAIVSEAESDIDWEMAAKIEDTEIAKPETSTVELVLDLEGCTMEQPQLISPEEELTLRNFLEGLNLVNSPEDAFRQVRERELSTVESIKARRARKRALLEQYFTPMMQNPRFLEVISEETSDFSDREQPSLTHHLKHGTPEPEIPQQPPRRRKEISNPAILVSTKLVDVPVCSTNTQSSSEAEIVYLEDSSNSTTPDPKSDNEDEKDTTVDILSSANSSVADLRESETTEEIKQVKVSVKKNDVLVTSSESISGEIKSSDILEAKTNFVSELTPPPTPENEHKIGELDQEVVAAEETEAQDNQMFANMEVTPGNIELFLNTLSENKVNADVKEQTGDVQIVHTNKANNRKIKILKLDDLSPPIVISPKHDKYLSFDTVHKIIEDSRNPTSPKETRVPITVENKSESSTTNVKKIEIISSPSSTKEVLIPISIEQAAIQTEEKRQSTPMNEITVETFLPTTEQKIETREASTIKTVSKSTPKSESTSIKETIIPVVVETSSIAAEQNKNERGVLSVIKDQKTESAPVTLPDKQKNQPKSLKEIIIPMVVETSGTKTEPKKNKDEETRTTNEVLIPITVEASTAKVEHNNNDTHSQRTSIKKTTVPVFNETMSQRFQPKSLKETIIPIIYETSATKTEQKRNEQKTFVVETSRNYNPESLKKKIQSISTNETLIPIIAEVSSTKTEQEKNKKDSQPISTKETIIPVVSEMKKARETFFEPKHDTIKQNSIEETIIPVTVETFTTKKKQKNEPNFGPKEVRIPVIVDSEIDKLRPPPPPRKMFSTKEDLLNRGKNTKTETTKEVNIPISVEKDSNIDKTPTSETIVSSSKEVIVPITIEKNSSEIEKKASTIFKKIRVESTPIIVHEKEDRTLLPKEFTVPISVESRNKSEISSSKEVLIPISIEDDKLSTKYEKFSSRIQTPKKELENLETVSIFKDPNSPVKQVSVTSEIESPSKEVESICHSKAPESMFYSNVLSPSVPSPSPSLSSGSSSRATSTCTAKYNPMTSSIADITSIKETPPTLRELCVNFLMSIPFGADILQELADVSSSIEHLTKNLCSEEKWVGLPTEEDPRLLVCLSPTQKCELEKSKKVGNEASKLLDLHSKFIYRTSYHDDGHAKTADVSNRLLAIIRDAEEPKTRKFSTLPRDMETARLKAKDLSEWLELARNKSRSNLNLSKDENRPTERQRRSSLPHDFYEQQMQYLREKEREIERELEMLEEEKWRLAAEMAPSRFKEEDFHISRKGDFAEKKSRPISMPVATEIFRQQMYEEYMGKMAEREERKQQKVIKVKQVENSPSAKTATGIEDEFMSKVKEKQKLGKLKTEEESDKNEDDEKMPKHLREFMDIAQQSENSPSGVWSPGQKQETQSEQPRKIQSNEIKDEPISPVWTPKSATSSPTVERKEFRPVKFESPVLGRKNYRGEEQDFSESSTKEPPWKLPETSSDTGVVLSSTLEKRLPTSHSSPASGFSDLPSTRLPKAQNPTITLLQKAREGQLPKGALYIEQEQIHKRPHNDKPPMVGPGEILYKIKNEYTSESDGEKPRKMADLGPRKFEGIGPTTKDGMPLILRSEIKDANQSKWYKRMYDTIHKQRPHRDEYVTVRYKQRRGQYPYTSGYLSEPEPGAYDSDFTDYKYATLDRRRANRDKENDYVVSSTMPRSVPDKVGASVIKHGHDPYKNQPGRIENYIPGHSSISDKEAKEHLEQQKRVPQTKSFINQALKESGYESDSTLVFRRRDDTAQQLNPSEQKEAYKIIQKGGDIPLHGLRKPAPERPKEPEPPVPPPKGHHGLRNLQQESPRKYVENEVTIHYKTPVRQEIKEYLSEDELAHRQAEAMKKIYQEERRRKYLQVSKSLQELQDMNNRRHTDNFIPSQKSPIPLNRYDDFDDLSPPVKPRPRSPEPRLMARALYNFVGQTARELTFRKGDLIYVRRQVDKNWYEGELNAMVGLFPVNYVEIVPFDTAKSTPRKSHEGQARAKYNFVAQTQLELSLGKGELVVITRRVDDNWFEGKIGGRKGIFPVSYVDVLIDPSDPPPPSTKPVAAPAAHSLLLNGSAGGKESMGSHSYTPNLSSNQLTTSGSYHAKPVQVTGYGSLGKGGRNPMNQTLHIETQAEPIPYRALYKYLPQNDDELELLEGDTVYVLEKCDDGWYVGSSERTGAFGTFPGNYVEKI